MIWYLIDFCHAGDNWQFDVKASSADEAIDKFQETEAYQSGDCRINSISAMTKTQAHIAQKNYDRIMSNRKSYEERLKELEAEDEEFKITPLFSRLLRLYRERMKADTNDG